MNLDKILCNRKRILITGGAGFIGSTLIRKILNESSATILNLDKLGYASNKLAIEGKLFNNYETIKNRYKFLKLDLINYPETVNVINEFSPDIIYHLAAESHVDNSIAGPKIFMESNIIGTFNLLEASRKYYLSLSDGRKKNFLFHHISTDEVFGSLGKKGKFSEKTSYSPRSPYSASKAASDHLVRAWFHTYDLPIIITNCSNNFGPWQFPEKLLPLTILNALQGKNIPLYGDGKNIRDWLYVEDHIDALLITSNKGKIGESYCIGGFGEMTNYDLVNKVCSHLDQLNPKNVPHKNLIRYVKDRPGHDMRYSIDSKKIIEEIGWYPKHTFNQALLKTIQWYLSNPEFHLNIKRNQNKKP